LKIIGVFSIAAIAGAQSGAQKHDKISGDRNMPTDAIEAVSRDINILFSPVDE